MEALRLVKSSWSSKSEAGGRRSTMELEVVVVGSCFSRAAVALVPEKVSLWSW